MNKNDASYFLSRNHAECDIVLNSIIDSKRERIEKIEVTTVRDVYEKIVWESEIKTPTATRKKKLTTPLAMKNGDKTITENHVKGSSAFTSDHNELNTVDLLNTSEASIYYEIENDDVSESAQISTNQEVSFYPHLDDVKQIEADINGKYAGIENTVTNVGISGNVNDSTDTEKHNSKSAKINETAIRREEENYNTDSNNKNNNSNISSTSNRIENDDASNNVRSGSTDRSVDNNNDSYSRSISTASSSVILKGYPHDRNDQFSKLTRKYFKYIHRYHIGDTLSNYFRGQFQMQMRAIGANYLTVGLFGQAGSGKSAFLNSLYSAMNGTYVEYSPERRTGADSESEPGATNRRVELRLTETIVILDNRATDFSKSSITEIVKQCGKSDFFILISFFVRHEPRNTAKQCEHNY